MEGLQAFLLPPPYEQLQRAAEHGAVIVVNVAELRSDAIIILLNDDPVLVHLPNATPSFVRTTVDRLRQQIAECDDYGIPSALQDVWAAIVDPVTRRLCMMRGGIPDRSRVWWCVAGVASELPLHVARPNDSNAPSTQHTFLSSYTPALDILAQMRRAHE